MIIDTRPHTKHHCEKIISVLYLHVHVHCTRMCFDLTTALHSILLEHVYLRVRNNLVRRVDTVQRNHSAESHSAECQSTEKPQCRTVVVQKWEMCLLFLVHASQSGMM